MQDDHNLKRSLIRKFVILAAVLLCAVPTTVGAADLPDYLVERGGVIYPNTGDSMQTIFNTPPHITDYLKPGMMLGVLPSDCMPASGPIGDYFQCHHDLVLKPYTHDNIDVYLVVEEPK
jgi:hypothetical protein